MSFEQTMQIVTALGAWVAGIGSLAAAIIALWLARRGSKVRLRSNVGLRVMIGGDSPKEELLEISTTNVGERPVIISNIGWCIGKRKNKKYGIQTFSHPLSDQCPKNLEYGETASFKIFFSDPSHWLHDFSTDFVEPREKRSAKTLRVQIFTSIGQIETVIPEKRFLERMESIASKAEKDRDN